MVLFLALKCFVIVAGFWNFFDGLVSLRVSYLGHTRLSDFCRIIRLLIGLCLILSGLFL